MLVMVVAVAEREPTIRVADTADDIDLHTVGVVIRLGEGSRGGETKSSSHFILFTHL